MACNAPIKDKNVEEHQNGDNHIQNFHWGGGGGGGGQKTSLTTPLACHHKTKFRLYFR